MSREQSLARAFVELADARQTGLDDIDFLKVLARHCVDLVGWPAIAILLADQDDVLHVVATWPDDDVLANVFGRSGEDGPCVDSYRGREPVRIDLAGPEPAGPRSRFAREAGDAGYSAVFAFPLLWREDSIGSYALFAEAPAGLEPGNLDLAQALAEAATITILRRRELERAETLANQLQGALNSRVVIEQAKGILAERGGLDMEGAFDVLRAYARKNRIRLAVVAREIVEGRIPPEQLLGGRGGPGGPEGHRPGGSGGSPGSAGPHVTPPGRARPTDPRRPSDSSRDKQT